MYTVDTRGFARNFKKNGSSKAAKKLQQGIDNGEEENIDEIKKMMGISNSFSHLVPEMKNEDDLRNIFGEQDPLAVNEKDRIRQVVERENKIQKDFSKLLANPENSLNEL